MSFDGHNLPAPVDWQKFERLCRDLWAAIWEDRNTQAHGRSGQPQHGVDVFGIPNGERVYSAVQCKRRGSSADAGEVTESELREEVAKAQNFVPKIGGAFILATTGPRDAKIQRVARILSEQQRANGQFSVHVWSWDDIQAEIGRRDSVFAQHFADLIGTVRSFDREHSLETEGDVRHPTVRAHAGAASSRSAQVTEPAAVLEPEHRAQIDAIRRVLQDGQPTMALQQAEALRARVWSAASASPRAHLLALIGHTKLALGEETAAAKLFVQMVDHTPSDPGSQANAALGHLILGSNAAALAWAQKALAQAPTEATAAQVSVLLDPRPDADVLATYEAVLGQRSELFSALADRAMKRGDIEMGKRWFLEALALAPDDAEVLGATGCVLVDEISAVAEVRDLLTAQERAQLVRGIELVGRAWALLKDNAVRKARLAWLVSGAEAKRLLRAPDAAATADEALAVGGALPELIALRAAIASDVGDHQRVCELLEKLPNPNVGVRGLLAAARANLGDVAGALTAWEDLLACELPLAIREQAEQNYVYTLISLQRGSDARCTVERWLTETPDDLGRVLVACDTASRLGDGAFRDAQLNRAVALARSDTSSRLLLRLGDALMRAGRPSDAADIFGLAVEPDSDNVYSRRLLQALYESGRFDSALQSCRRLGQSGGSTRFATEVESLVHEKLGDLPRARAVCEEYLRVDPADNGVRLRLGVILLRIGDSQALERALLGIDRAAAERNVEHAGMLAQLMWEAGRPADALEILFQARRLNMDNAAAHLQYLGRTTFLARDRSPPEVAGLDVAVELIGEGAPGWMLTASAREADIGHNVYPMEHPVAKAVLGKRAGDEVVFGERFGPQWRVAALDSKYGFALRQSLGFFPARFPTQRGLERHRVREGDAEADFAAQLKERIEADEPHRTAVLREYGEGHLTVGGVATALGRPTLEAIGIVAACAAGLRGTTASPAEQQASTDVLRDRETVLVADVSACMMLDMLGVLRDGTLAHRRLAITQTTLDEFRAELMRWKAHSPDGFMSIGVHDGRLVRIETTADQVDQRRKNLESLVAWLQTKISIVALSASRVERLAPMADLAEFLGQSFWDSMLAASEPGHALLSDDLALRQLAAGEFATPGTCSPMLLQAEANDGTMGGDRYGECMVHLICAGYRHVSSDARVLRAAARMELWRPQGRVLRVLDTLKGPNVRSASAAMVAAAFFRLLWLDVVVPQQRETMCIAVLDAICTGRAARSVLPVFKAYLRRNFVLLPFASAAALQTVAAWERMRFI